MTVELNATLAVSSRLIRLGLGIVLVGASALKVHWQTHSPPQLHAGLLENSVTLVIAAAGELCLGSVLISGLFPPVIRWVSISVFLLFACVAIGESFSGFKSCGCFGDGVHIPPWAMATFDSFGVFCFVRCKPVENVPAGLRKLQIAIAVMIVAVGSVVGVSWGVHRPAVVVAQSKPQSVQADPFGTPGLLVVLEPEKLAGKPFLLGSHIDIGPQLVRGLWVVLLVHHDCDRCAAAIPKYQAALSATGATRLAIVELIPYASASDPAPWSQSIGLCGQLDTTRDWFATTPVAILLDDGIVQAATDGDKAATPDAGWFRRAP